MTTGHLHREGKKYIFLKLGCLGLRKRTPTKKWVFLSHIDCIIISHQMDGWILRQPRLLCCRKKGKKDAEALSSSSASPPSSPTTSFPGWIENEKEKKVFEDDEDDDDGEKGEF